MQKCFIIGIQLCSKYAPAYFNIHSISDPKIGVADIHLLFNFQE